ncbi:MAG TPA: biotin transporter BioY [Gemmatimonadales bacterium]|nr:biotin transporter BioY [Gemmatimonadales bacterium]
MNASDVRPALEARARVVARLAPRILGVVIGAAVVALAAQVAVPLPFTVVPLTLQPLAVLVVGGLLGAAGGATALVLYLAAGATGLPVFAGGTAGAIHLIGPTGGYLLAFPVAAAVTGRLSGLADGRSGAAAVGRVLLATAAGMLVIHVGGLSQLILLSGGPATAFRLGFRPFFANDLVKVGLAALLILGLRPRFRIR